MNKIYKSLKIDKNHPRESFKQRFLDLSSSLFVFIKESAFELKKMVYPTRVETMTVTFQVIVAVVVLSLILWLIDLFFGWIVRIFLGF